MDIRLALMAGSDIPVPECQLTIHQPRIHEIALLGETNFFQAVQCLNINKNSIEYQGENLLEDRNNFQILMMILTDKKTVDKRDAVSDLFQIIFPNYKVKILPHSLLFSFEGGFITIDENNFDILQEALKQVFCFNSQSMQQQSFNPADKKAQEIANKLMRGRQRVAAEKGEDTSSIFSQYVSSLTVGLQSMSLKDCLNLTMFQLFDLVERYMLYTSWDIDLKSRLAGANPDSKPDNWMKNLH